MPLVKEELVDLQKLGQDIRRFAQEFQSVFSDANIDIDLADALSALGDLTVEGELAADALASIGDTEVTVDNESAIAGLQEVASEAEELDGQETNVSLGLEGEESVIAGLDEVGQSTEELIEKFSAQLPASAQAVVRSLAQINPTVAVVVAAFAALAVAGTQVQAVTNDIVIATGAQGAALTGLRDSALVIASEVPESMAIASDAVGILNTFLGSTGQELELLSIGLIDVSRLLGEDASSNAENFAQTLNQFGIEAEDGVATLDLLFAATQKYGIGLGDLLGTLEGSGGIFRAVGLDIEQSTNLIGQFNLAGLSASDSQAAFTKLIATADSEGQSFNQTLINMQRAILGAANEQDAFAIGIEAFGTRSGVTFAEAIRSGIIDLENLQGALGDTTGLVAATTAQTETIGQSLRETINEILLVFAPVAEFVADVVLQVVQGIAAVADALPDGLFAVAAAAGAAALAFGPLGAAAVGAVAAFQVLSGLLRSDIQDSLDNIATAGDRYTASLVRQTPANVETEESIRPLIEAYNELKGATEGLEEAGTKLIEDIDFATFYQDLDEASQQALDSTADFLGGFDNLVAGLELGTEEARLLESALILGPEGNESRELARAAIDQLRASQQEAINVAERDLRVRLNQEDGLTAYEIAVRDLGRTLDDTTRSATPYVDAQNQINEGLIAGAEQAARATERYLELNTSFEGFVSASSQDLPSVNIGAIERQVVIEQEIDEDAFALATTQLSALITTSFGNPLKPAFDPEEQISLELWIERVIELQTAINEQQFNLLKFTGRDDISDDAKQFYTDIFAEAGKEGGALLVAQAAEADATALTEGFEEAARQARLGEILTEVAAANLEGVFTTIEVDSSELDDLFRDTYSVSAETDLSTTDLEAALEKRYNVNFDVAVDRTAVDQFANTPLLLRGNVIVDEVNGQPVGGGGGGAIFFDRGGIAYGPTYFAGEAGNAEMIAGKHHAPGDVVSWMDELGMSGPITEVLLRRMAPETFQAPQQAAAGFVPGGVLEAGTLALISQQIEAVVGNTSATAGNTGALGKIADSTETAARILGRIGRSAGSIFGQGRRTGWKAP